jgi:hypothetical protein
MKLQRALLAAVLATACSCSSSEEKPSVEPPDAAPPECQEGSPGCIGWLTCPPELEKDPEGGCREILPAAECAAGTMPLLGKSECVPVGTTACAAGFEPDASGWGCRAVVPAKACTGATRDALGSTTCVPVGDCSAAFPPAGALVVDATFNDAELGPKKFKTVGAAVAAAKAGEVVAIQAGTYAEGIVARTNVTVVGRCAAQVRLVGTGLDVHGVLADRAKGAVVKGVTLVDHYEGARAMDGGTLVLEDVVVESARGVGLIAWNPSSSLRAVRVVVRKVKPQTGQTVEVASVNADEGGTVELVDSSVTESWAAGAVATNPNVSTTPSVLEITRTVIRDTNLEEHTQAGAGLVVSGLSRGKLSESAILDSRRLGVTTIFETSELTVSRSEIRRTLDDKGAEVSAAVYAEGGTIALDDVSIHDAVQGGIFARNKGSVTAKNTVIHGTKPGADGAFGMAGWADSGAKLAFENSALVDNAYYGVAALGSPSGMTLKSSLIRGTAAQKVADGGLGRGVNVEDGATADLDGVSIVANDGEGLFVRGETAQGKRATIKGKRVLVADSQTDMFGTGLFIARGALVELDGAVFRSTRRVGIVVNETLGEKGTPSEASLTHVIVRDTKPTGRPTRNTATLTDLNGIGLASAGKVSVRSSAFVGNTQFGVLVGSPKTVTTFENVLIASTRPSRDGTYGHGLVSYTGSSLVVRGSELVGNTIGLVFSGASAVLANSRVRANAVGIHAQQGSELVVGVEAPETPDEGVVFVTEDSEFLENESRVGGGDIPLPANPFGK